MFPWLADRYGRKRLLKYCCIIGTLCFTILALSPNKIVLWITSFGIGAVEIGVHTLSVILCVETIDFKRRSQYIGSFSIAMSAFSIFIMILVDLNINWRYLVLIPAVLLLLQVFLMSYVVESPRFLATNQGNIEAATKVIQKISIMNGEGTFKYAIISENSRSTRSMPIKELFSNKIIVLQLFAGSAAWTNAVIGYYSIFFLMPDSTSSALLQNIGYHIVEIISILAALCVINDIGRKKTTALIFLFVGFIFFAIDLLQYSIQDMYIASWTKRILLHASIFLLYTEFCFLYIYTAEMFPTYIRGTAFSLCNIISRIISTVGFSFFPGAGSFGVSLIAGSIMILTAASCVVFQETQGKEIEEMIECTLTQPLLQPRLINYK